MKTSILNPKSLLVMAAVFAIGFTACKKEPPVPSVPELKVLVGGVEETSLAAAIVGQTFNATVTATRDWSVTGIPEWITVTPDSGKAANGTAVTITVAENEGTTSRNASLIFALEGNAVKKTIAVTQQSPDSPGVDAIYFEDLGEFRTGTQIKSDGTSVGGWPSFTEFTTWRRSGTVDQSGVTYTGTGSVRNSGKYWDSDPNVSTSSTAPYVYQGATGGHTFIIGDINLGGKTSLTFNWIMQDTKTSTQPEPPDGPFIPTTEPITPSTVVFEAGFDGNAYAVVAYTVGTVIGNGWTNVSAEFKVPSGTDKLYLRFSGYAGGQGLRSDNFSLTEGGNGDLIDPQGGGGGDLTETTIAALNDRITTTSTPVGDYFVKGIVVTDMAKGNYTNGALSIMTEGATTAGNGILLYTAYGSNIKFEDASGNPLYNAGDELTIDLSTLSLQAYRGSGASGNEPYVHELIIPAGTTLTDIIEVTKTGVALTPVAITYDKIADYQNMLVKIEEAQSQADNITVWPANATNFTYRDDITKIIPVFLASHSEIVGTAFSTGNGTIQGIAYVYGGSSSAHSVAQIVPRSIAEVSGLTGARIGGVTPQFGVSSQTIAVPAAGGNATVSVTGNVAWTASVTAGAANITSGPTPASGNGAGTITLVFPENTDTANAKEVTLTVTTTADVTTKTFAVVFTQAKASGSGVDTFTETFTGFTSTNNSYTAAAATGTFTSNDVPGVIWSYAGTAHNQSGAKFIIGRYSGSNTNPGSLATNTLTTGVGSININWIVPFNDSSTGISFKVLVNDVEKGIFTLTPAETSAGNTGTYTIDDINVSGNAIIKIESNSTGRPGVNGVQWTSY